MMHPRLDESLVLATPKTGVTHLNVNSRREARNKPSLEKPVTQQGGGRGPVRYSDPRNHAWTTLKFIEKQAKKCSTTSPEPLKAHVTARDLEAQARQAAYEDEQGATASGPKRTGILSQARRGRKPQNTAEERRVCAYKKSFFHSISGWTNTAVICNTIICLADAISAKQPLCKR